MSFAFKGSIWHAQTGRIDMNLLKTSALAAALTGSLTRYFQNEVPGKDKETEAS
jgi:hypothetical protein